MRVIALVLVAALAGTAHAGPTATVTIDNFSFTPATLTVAPGTVVSFVNHDDIPHTSTGAPSSAKGVPPLWKSPALDTDEHFERTFDTPGTYPYFCSLHPHMQGVVVVK